MRESTNYSKYIITIITTIIIFLIVMIFLYDKYQKVIDTYNYHTLRSRLEYTEWDKEDNYLRNVAQRLYMDGNFESAFDEYWEFATIECYYMQGLTLKRAILEGDSSRRTDLEVCTKEISDYIATTQDQKLKNNAKNYLKILTEK